MEVTKEMLKFIYANATDAHIDKYLPALNKYMEKYEINSVNRQAAFLAQIGHESGELRYPKEIWGPTSAQKKYEGRSDLGNNVKGDGVLFMGRGLMQVTGRANYTIFDKWLHEKGHLSKGVSIVKTPDIVATNPELAVLSAIWYWDTRNLNKFANRPE